MISYFIAIAYSSPLLFIILSCALCSAGIIIYGTVQYRVLYCIELYYNVQVRNIIYHAPYVICHCIMKY